MFGALLGVAKPGALAVPVNAGTYRQPDAAATPHRRVEPRDKHATLAYYVLAGLPIGTFKPSARLPVCDGFDAVYVYGPASRPPGQSEWPVGAAITHPLIMVHGVETMQEPRPRHTMPTCLAGRVCALCRNGSD